MISETYYDAKAKVWSGPERSTNFNPEASIGQLAIFMLQRFPKDNVAQISAHTGEKLTSSDLATLSIRVAQNLQKLGLKQKDIIGLCASNTSYVAPLAIGAFAAGVILSPSNPIFEIGRLKHIYGITRPKVFFCDGGVYKTVKQALDELGLDCPIYTLKDHELGDGKRTIEELIAETGSEKSFVPVKLEEGGDQTAAIMFSSGSTGLPKGVCLSHKTLSNMPTMDVYAEDVLVNFSTLDWITGVITLIGTAVSGTTRIITDQPFTPQMFLRIIEEFSATFIIGPPAHLVLILKCPDISKRNLSTVRTVITGGATPSIATVEQAKKHMPNATIYNIYATTELGSGVAFGVSEKPGDCGKLMENVTLKIIDENGKSLGPGQSGEIVVKKHCGWAGYYGNPEATKEIFDDEHWLRSGDMGYMDEEGKLIFVDRIKEIMKHKRFHYSPTEIEQVVADIPDVVEVVVCGIPNEVNGDVPTAAVVKKPNSKLTASDIQKFVKDKLPFHLHLDGGVYFFDALPKTASGKNVRRLVKEAILKREKEGA